MAAETVESLKKQIEDLNKKLKEAGGLGIDLQEAFRKAGNDTEKLNKYVDTLNKQYESLVDNADYVYRTFQDITAELKNQNLLLKLGKGAFKAVTDIAQDLSYYQKNSNDLTNNQFKKFGFSIKAQKQELDFVIARLEASKKSRNLEIESLSNLEQRTPKQTARLKELLKENELLFNAKEAIKSGIPLLEKELHFTKQISDTRKNLGGIATATAGLLSKYGGSLSSFLNVSEATEAVEDFNKNLIDGALKSKAVQDKLLDIEAKKLKFQKQLDTGRDEKGRFISRKKAQEELNKLEKESYDVRESAVASVNNLGNKFKSLGVLAQGLGAGLKKSLTDPLTIISFILDRANQFNKTSVDIGKNLGYGTNRADKMAQNLASVANYSTNINVTFKNAAEAMSELNTATGGVANYSADTLETQIMLTKQLGLSGEEAAGIYKFSVLTGKSSEKVNDEMVGAFAATRNAVKGSANFKTTMAEAAKVSGQLAANLQNNPALITSAVVQAQALGTTLEKTKDQGKQLLDFESSIENELKAELLTGQSMNLERARAAALQGDQVTVMKELANQGMTLNKFQNMNVIAQESFAKALGLSADELAEQLKKQKIAQEQGKSLAEITKEEALEAEKRQSIQDKFNNAILKLQDFFGNLVAGPVAVLLDMLTNVLNVITLIFTPLQMMYDFASKIGNVIGGWLDTLGVVGKVLKVIAGIAIVLAAYSAAASVADIPFIGWALAPIVAAGILGLGFGLLNAQKAGDINSPANGKTQVSTKEGDLFELSKNDDLVAFPGASNLAKQAEKKAPNIAESNLISTSPTDDLAKKAEKKSPIVIESNLAKQAEKKAPNIAESNSISTSPTINTNTNPEINKDGGMTAPNIDLTPLIEEMKALRAEQKTTTAAVNKLHAKDTTINMDGKKVGTTLSQNSHKVA